ncbi:MAG: hypothetical protein K6G88_09575 [Lachnospiraceae bacterium]|nr:hypothetical protein [Lachnospiraceae bacterium]
MANNETNENIVDDINNTSVDDIYEKSIHDISDKTIDDINEVKNELQITDWEEITQKQLLQIGSMLPNISPEAAQEIMDSLPDFSANAKEALQSVQNTVDTALKENSSSNKQVLDMYNQTIDNLNEQLKRDDLSAQEKEIILNKLSRMLQAADRKDSENKEFLKVMTSVLATTTIAVFSIGLAILGTAKTNPKDLLPKK